MQTFVENGMYVRHFAGDGLPLLLVHGLGDSGVHFEEFAATAGLRGRRQLIPDLPGYGKSCHPQSASSLQSVARHLGDWLLGRGERQVIVVGHSMGGVLALMLAELFPDLVAAVLDIEGNKSPGDCTYSRRISNTSAAEFQEHGRTPMLDNIYRSGVEDLAHRGYYAGLRLCDVAVLHRHATELVALSAACDLAARLAALNCPKHYITGLPRGAPVESLELAKAAGVITTQVSGSGHWPFVDQPDETSAVVRRFLDEVSRRD